MLQTLFHIFKTLIYVEKKNSSTLKGTPFAPPDEGQGGGQLTPLPPVPAPLLGSPYADDRSSEREIRVRKIMAKDAFNNHQQLLTNSLTRKLKKRLVKTEIWSVLLYGSETWMMKKVDIKKLQSQKMW